MALRSPTLLAGAFLVLAVAYLAHFNISIRVDANAALSRFDALVNADAPARAAVHGERALAMKNREGISSENAAPLKANLAKAHIDHKSYERGAELLSAALATDWAEELEIRERIVLQDKLARSSIHADSLDTALSIYASFLELAGDQASTAGAQKSVSIEAFYAKRVANAATLFAETLNHASADAVIPGTAEARLAAANQMASLGAFFAMRSDGQYAAAGLLSSAHQIRSTVLGGDHQDTVQLTLILGPIYRDLGRLGDAERLYLEAFHAQESSKGANSPDLSLYIKLLSGVYEQQGRMTEAQALNEHMRNLFRDAFGAQRYTVNRTRDRRKDVNRPVSQYFLLESEYAPGDLVSAAQYSIPVSKAPSIDEMKLRLAADPDADPRESNMPARLAHLISLCRSESGERISLRSGYRSYSSQHGLYQRIGHKGTVTPPGMSEHQTGLAVDIDVNGRFMRQNDKSYQCFEENAFRFGFILSYPPGNDYLPGEDSHEPWHWRYVGVRTAQLYREAGPHHKPQEFLAALPCYQEQAAAGVFPTVGQPDICLNQVTTVATEETQAAQPESETDDSARILNTQARGRT